MPLIYAFVARRTTVLAEYTNYSGNFSTIATQVGPRASRAMGNARERARGSSVPAVGSSGFGRSRARVRMETRDPRGDDDERARVRSRDDDDDDDDDD